MATYPVFEEIVHAGHATFDNAFASVRFACVKVSQTVQTWKGLIFKAELNPADLWHSS